MKYHSYIIPILGLGLSVNCGDDKTNSNPDASLSADADVTLDADITPNTTSYVFESRFEPGVSPVAKSGQVFRNILTQEMNVYLAGVTAQVDNTSLSSGDVLGALEFYFEFDSTTSGTIPLTFDTTPASLQTIYDDVSTGKNLVGKIAGNDAATDYKNWTSPGAFIGWNTQEGGTPESLLRTWFQKIDEMAVARVNDPELEPDGTVVSEIFLTAEGQDLQQLIQKFLLGAINISQGMDDYLDDDVAGKGLLASNLRDSDKPYSALGRAWDEAFGYFGAAINYEQYTDEERATQGGRPEYQGGYNDMDGDSRIDLVSEYNFASSVNCGKRDFASDASAKTTFGDDAFTAFREGRLLILSVDGELNEAQMSGLRGYRDTVRENWEKCIAASMVRYVNLIEKSMAAFGTNTYSFADHAKYWSELKGFSLGLQFNPASPLNSGAFIEFQTILGIAPVLENATSGEIAQAIAGLGRLKMLLRTAYDFDTNLAGW